MSPTILVIVVILALQTEQTNESTTVDYIFNVVSETIEDVTIKLFNVLKLPPNLVDTNAIQKDLDMYSNLKTTTILNYKTFQQIADITQSIVRDNGKSNKTSIEIFINEIINATINEEKTQGAIAEVFYYFIPLIIRSTDPEDSDNLSLEFIKEFIDKINQTELEEFYVDESPNFMRRKKYPLLKLQSEHNLINPVSSENDFTEINDNRTKEGNGIYINDFTKNVSTDSFGNITKKVYETKEDSDENEIKNFVSNGLLQTGNQSYNNNSRRMDIWEPDVDSPDYWLQTRRIFDGKPASIKTYPFMVSIFDGNQFVCGGSIIKSNLVLTAASCLQRVYLDRVNVHSETSIYVRFGSEYLSSGGYLVHVSHIIFHPEFDPVTMNHNLVLLYVRKEDFAKLAWVTKIKYKREESLYGDFREGKDRVKILGWGHQNDILDMFSQVGQKVPLFSDYLHIFDLEDCQTIYTNLYVTDKNFCAGAHTTSGGACKNDVGGPAIRHGVLLGIVSFGPRDCSAPDKPTVFTKITAYVEWIHDVVKGVVRNIKPTKPVFVYNEDYSRRRSYIHSLPEFRQKKKSKNIVKLKTKKTKTQRKYYTDDESDKEHLNESETINSQVRISKNALPDPDKYFLEFELKSKTPITHNQKNLDDGVPYGTANTMPITPISVNENVTTALNFPSIGFVDTQTKPKEDSQPNEEKAGDESNDIVIEFNPNIVDYRPDISISMEEEKITTHKKKHKSRTTHTQGTENDSETVTSVFNFNHNFVFNDKKQSEETGKKWMILLDTPQNTKTTEKYLETTKTTNQALRIDYNINIGSDSFENDTNLIDIYNENYEDLPPVASGELITSLVTPPHSTLGFDLNYYSGADKSYRNDSDGEENVYGSYEIDFDEEDYGGLSIEPLGVMGQATTTTRPTSTITFMKNISKFVTPFDMNTPKKIRFESITKRETSFKDRAPILLFMKSHMKKKGNLQTSENISN